MTLPLQPMTTAPRDGSWIWAVFSQSMVRVRWDDSNQSWRSAPGFEYEDEEYLGWLDLAALVRDSERLALVILMFQDHEWVHNLAAKIEHPHDLDAWRAAIDKEASRG